MEKEFCRIYLQIHIIKDQGQETVGGSRPNAPEENHSLPFEIP